MTAPDYLLDLLDRYQSHYADEIIDAGNALDARVFSGCLSAVQDLSSQVQLYRDGLTKDASWTIDATVKRLQKVSLRPSVQRDPVAADNIRLATRALRRLIEPAPTDTEPIDIFIFNS